MRLATTKDRARLEGLLSGAFAGYAHGMGKATPGPYDWLPDRIDRGEVYVRAEDEALIGTVILRPEPQLGRLTIDMLAIDPRQQGQGRGARLLRAVEEHARNLGMYDLRLHTAAHFDHLIRFYLGQGFTIARIGPHPDRQDGLDRAFLRKDLSSRHEGRV